MLLLACQRNIDVTTNKHRPLLLVMSYLPITKQILADTNVLYTLENVNSFMCFLILDQLIISLSSLQLITQPPLSCSIRNRKVVCISPTAKGTFVPQHYGTMGSFDTLMAELTQRHPEVGRQRIVDALMELQAKHRGVLSGLPLRTIREMTSELLTRPVSDTQLWEAVLQKFC